MNKEQLTAKCKELGIDTTELTTNAQLEEAIKAKETEIAAAKAAEEEAAKKSEEEAAAKAAEEEAAKKAEEAAAAKLAEKKGDFILDGDAYAFTKRCPAKLQVNGKVFTKEKLINNADALEFLVIGNSPFVEKL